MFERLPNDLLYETFDYLPTVDILRAFNGLNKRLDSILNSYDRYDLKFKSVSRPEFDFVCCLVRAEQIRSLILSDNDDTCRQIHTFFKHFNPSHLTNLQSLTLIYPEEEYLTRLLPKLNNLTKLSNVSLQLTHHIIAETLLTSLRWLSLGACSMKQLFDTLIWTPNLHGLNVQLMADSAPNEYSTLPTLTFLQIRQLKIQLAIKSGLTYEHLSSILSSMPNLKKFTFIAERGLQFIHGDRWEQLIRTYIPELKEFHFKIDPYSIPLPLTQVLARFQTSFWLIEKKWFIHYHHHYQRNGYRSFNRGTQFTQIYTLPYPDQQFILETSSISTNSFTKDAFHSITDLHFTIYDGPLISRLAEKFYFSNLNSLTLCNFDQLSSLDDLMDLSKLTSLTLPQHNSIGYKQFLSYLLVPCRQLHSLNVTWHTLTEITNHFGDVEICSILRKQIKELNISSMLPEKNKEELRCIDKLASIFAENLQKLTLSTAEFSDILEVVDKMPLLGSLKLEYNTASNSVANDQFQSWLSQHIPRTKFTWNNRGVSETRSCLVLWMPTYPK